MIEIMVKSGEVDAIMLLLMGPSGTDTGRPKGARGVDMTKAWDQITEDVINQVTSLYDLMMECEVPIYPVANQIEAKSMKARGKRLMIYRTIDSACRTIKAMADYNMYKNSK